MIAVQLTVPIACWRKGHARELLETEEVPSPAMCYGALLSLVGEVDRERHRGARVTGGVIGRPARSMVVRTLWRVKSRELPPGVGDNAKPDLQQLLTQSEVVIWVDSAEESTVPTLEQRVVASFEMPDAIERFGGWSLGESTHLINDRWLRRDAIPVGVCRAFLLDPDGSMTLPVWVDHVGTSGTKYAVGRLENPNGPPAIRRLPVIG